MKLVPLLLSVLICLTAFVKSDPTREVEALDDQFSQAFVARNIDKMLQNVSADCVFYGTDVNEKWTLADFRAMLTKGIQNIPPFQTVSREIMPSPDGNTVVVVKVVKWALFKTDLRQIDVYTKQNGSWKQTMLSLQHTVPNQKSKALNEMMGRN